MNEPHGSAQSLARQGQPDVSRRVQPRHPFLEFRPEEIEQSIPARFEQQVARYPDRPAIVTKGDRITYGELNKAANRVARAILALRGDTNEPTAFLLGSRALAMAGILGILKAGKALVGLDPASPPARNIYMLEHSQAGLIVADDHCVEMARELAGSRYLVINIDEVAAAFSGENVGMAIAPDSLATVVYTSGSTGQPKGVMQSHRSLLFSCMAYTNRLHISADDRTVTLFSLAFMGGIAVSLHYLLNGACLCPFDVRERGMHGLADWLSQEGATVLIANSTAFRHFARTLGGGEDLSRVRLVSLGGEALYPQDAELYKKHFGPDCLFGNGLGSSEMTGVCNYLMDKETQIRTSVVPVGHEYPGLQVQLWDESGQDVGIGRVGQIVVRSRYLSPGYWRDPDLTQETFLPDPEGGDVRLYRMGDLGLRLADGCLLHLGREDQQVKIRGYRVEVVEVETALLALDGVREAVVVPRDDRHGEKRLVAYLVPASEPAPTVSALRRALVGKLPDYMIPSSFVVLESLPLGATGKVDRLALPEPAPTRPELQEPFMAPRNEVEARLVGIWEDVLGIAPVGVADDFFELGGSSLDYLGVLLKVEAEFGVTVPVASVGQGPTIERLARVLERGDAAAAPATEVAERPGFRDYVRTGYKRLSSGGAQRALSRTLRDQGPAFGRIVLPYGVGTRWLMWFCGRQVAQSTLFRRQVQLVKECLPLIGYEASAASDVIRQSLVSNLWRRWRGAALSRCSSEESARWVTVDGLPLVEDAFREGRGVVLITSHLALIGVMFASLRRAGFGDMAGVGYRYSLFETSEGLSLTSQLYEAQQALRRGGMALIVADGYMGSGPGFTCSFFGRSRVFRTGFAELALNSGTPIVPASVSMDQSGRTHVQFLPPLQADGAGHQEQVESLVLRYVDICRREWAENLGCLRWRHLERFLQLPPANEAAPSGDLQRMS
jgi:amino acid adenylation domain-containing protein